MKTVFYVLCSLFLTTTVLIGQTVTQPPSGGNQKSSVTQYIGTLAHITIDYSSPDVTSPQGEDRTGKIWGQLVPWGLQNLNFGLSTDANPSPWRAGANENTTFHFSHDMMVQGKPIKAGTYGFHVIPKETGAWTLIFSNNATAWGSFYYNPSEDALRVEATPTESEYHEWLTYEFTDRQPTNCTVALKWEKLALPIKIEVADIHKMYVDNFRKELQSTAGFNWQGWQAAAAYCYQNDVNLEEALTWADNAVNLPFGGEKNFTTLQTKANILEKLGKKEEAAATMKQAIEHPTAGVFQVHQYGRQLIAEGKKKEALEVFEYNMKNFGDVWPVRVGLARGYSALGEYDKALEHCKIALERAPDKLNKDSLVAAIEKLEKKQDMN
ncbi:MAG: DUF2911 domain-containing protein [Chitinophagales bacterium]